MAVEGTVSTEIDRLDTQLFGSGQSSARGAIALAGGYTATGGSSATVTVKVNCWTAGGDTRTVSHGRLNVVGVDTLVQQ